ncbi:MAG: hypothetical protein AB7I29_13460, partial [Geobacter sp.]
LLTLVSRNTQVTAAAMHGAGATSAQAGAATAMAIEAILAHQGGAGYGQYAKSQEFMNVMQNGLQGAGTGAGDIRLFQAMGGFDGPMTWEKIHQMNVLKQGGFMQSPELMTKIMGGLSGSKEARAGQLETMMASWGIKGASAEKLIEMNDSGFFGRLAKATNGGKIKIEELAKGDSTQKAMYREIQNNPAISKLYKEALKEETEIEAGMKLHEMFGKLEIAGLNLIKNVLESPAFDDLVNKVSALTEIIGDTIGISNGTGPTGAASKAPVAAYAKEYLHTYSRVKSDGGNNPSLVARSNGTAAYLGASLGIPENESGSFRDSWLGQKIFGSRSARNNNPGNLRYGSDAAAQKAGAIGRDKDGFAIFPSVNAGDSARSNLLFKGKYRNTKLTDMVAKYAPSSDGNNVSRYQQVLLNAVGGKNKIMSEYSPEEQQAIMEAMKKHEGWKPVASHQGAPSPKMASSHVQFGMEMEQKKTNYILEEIAEELKRQRKIMGGGSARTIPVGS